MIIKKIFQRVVSLFKLYLKNIFDGKITTLVGAILIGMGIDQGMSSDPAPFMEVSGYIATGLVLMGFKDPRFSTKE